MKTRSNQTWILLTADPNPIPILMLLTTIILTNWVDQFNIFLARRQRDLFPYSWLVMGHFEEDNTDLTFFWEWMLVNDTAVQIGTKINKEIITQNSWFIKSFDESVKQPSKWKPRKNSIRFKFSKKMTRNLIWRTIIHKCINIKTRVENKLTSSTLNTIVSLSDP